MRNITRRLLTAATVLLVVVDHPVVAGQGQVRRTPEQEDERQQNIARNVMAIEIQTAPTFSAGTSRVLFTLPGPLPGNPRQWKYVTPDGERVVFAVPVK